MQIIGARNYVAEEAAADAIYHAPSVWAHARAMQWWQRMNAVDMGTFKTMAASMKNGTKGMRWIGSVPLSVATIINEQNPDVYNDTTGQTMLKFLQRNPQFKVPR